MNQAEIIAHARVMNQKIFQAMREFYSITETDVVCVPVVEIGGVKHAIQLTVGCEQQVRLYKDFVKPVVGKDSGSIIILTEIYHDCGKQLE